MQFSIHTLRLLCVEDNKTTQMLYKALLEDLVQEVVCANNGEEGLEKYLENKIDIIITDYEMPKMNGLEMIEKIRERDKEIPIIFISAIDDIDVIIDALKLKVNNFVKKPINYDEVKDAFVSASKIILANKIIEEEKKKELETLQKKDSYYTYQEELAFEKELNILRNDFYYQFSGVDNISLIDFMYKPLDVVSGDAYSVRRVDENRTFYLIVDGMGKGFSASLSAMLMTSFVNHLVDKMLNYESFSLDLLIQESIDYIKPILLDEEALSLDYILFDNYYNKLHYAKFSMPSFLLENSAKDIIRIKSNNPPLSKWQGDFNLDTYDILDINKFLFYSDGIVENSVKDSNSAYAAYIEEDFGDSFTREEMKEKIFEKIATQEDDLTLVFINKFMLKNYLVYEKTFTTRLESMEEANEWYEGVLEKECTDKEKCGAEIVFTELMMNAYEHGNLGLKTAQKHKLLEDDLYIDTLLEMEQELRKEINVKVYRVNNQASSYIITQIVDEGEGFDTQILSEIFRHSKIFNGRGVFVSRKNSMGIYYNTKGNTVLYLSKV